jgi:hypothetical protein
MLAFGLGIHHQRHPEMNLEAVSGSGKQWNSASGQSRHSFKSFISIVFAALCAQSIAMSEARKLCDEC